MKNAEELQLESLAAVYQKFQINLSLKLLARLVRIPRKQLRKAMDIIQTERLETRIEEKGRMVKRTFHFGFHEFTIKQDHKERQIKAPHPDVQQVYVRIREWLEKEYEPHPNMYGFVKGRDYKGAVKFLSGKEHYFGFDIADAFPSITKEMLEEYLKKLGLGDILASTLSWLVTYDYNGRRRLPQGASSSPMLLNLVYKSMCRKINVLCRKNKISWAVDADDFNFAASSIAPETKEELLSIPIAYGFTIKEKKIKDNLGKTIPHMLGLTIVNGKIHMSHRRKNKFRRMIYAAYKFNSYSENKINGIKSAIQFIYGEEKKWPGWLRDKNSISKLEEGR
jgi:RNA-directed DNA polymerase